MVNASFQILKDTTDYFQNSLDIKNKNLTLLLSNFSLFSSGVFLLPKIFVTKGNKMTGG